MTLAPSHPDYPAFLRELKARILRARVSALVGCPRISIKAKTNEGLGPIGHKEAIACYAVAQLKKL